jgi:hypothetical protein
MSLPPGATLISGQVPIPLPPGATLISPSDKVNIGTVTAPFSSDAGVPVNLVTGEGAEDAARHQSMQTIGRSAEQMRGVPSLMGQPPASIATEKGATDTANAPIPTPENAAPQNKDLAKLAYQVPKVAAAASSFLPVGDIAAGLAKLFPSAERAGTALQDVRAVAGKVPIDTGKAGDTALELYEQSQRGAVLPKAVRQFVTRATDPEGEPITYEEAKDFQSNISRLSAN